MNNPNQNDPSTTLGVGGATSGQQGATPSHETQQETGGSGGDGLTRNQAGETRNAPSGAPAAERPPAGTPGSAMTQPGRGPQDTRPNQADPNAQTGAGLGTPETGGNQDASDLPPPR